MEKRSQLEGNGLAKKPIRIKQGRLDMHQTFGPSQLLCFLKLLPSTTYNKDIISREPELTFVMKNLTYLAKAFSNSRLIRCLHLLAVHDLSNYNLPMEFSVAEWFSHSAFLCGLDQRKSLTLTCTCCRLHVSKGERKWRKFEK